MILGSSSITPLSNHLCISYRATSQLPLRQRPAFRRARFRGGGPLGAPPQAVTGGFAGGQDFLKPKDTQCCWPQIFLDLKLEVTFGYLIVNGKCVYQLVCSKSKQFFIYHNMDPIQVILLVSGFLL